MKFFTQSITLVAFSIAFSLRAQVAPSPDAMGTVSFHSPQDLFRGYITETVPLYGLQIENGFTVPIQLAYQTKGIKVDDIASSVGLGWNLISGGAITRVMRDQPDDQSTFTTTLNRTIVESDQIAGDKGYDFEKDIFYVQHPGGGFKFVSKSDDLETGSEFSSIPLTRNKIAFFKTSNSVSWWEVTDINGIKYVFGKNSESRETTTTKSWQVGESIKPNQDWTYISTWYLEEIIFPNLDATQGYKVTFTYSNDGKIDNQASTYTATYTPNFNQLTLNGPTITESRSETSTTISRLLTIESKKATIDFLWADREDQIMAKKLQGLRVKDHEGTVKHTADLFYEYTNAANGDPALNKRLKLTSVNKNGLRLASFQYTDDSDATYNLPARNSIKQDKYGYYRSDVSDRYDLVSGEFDECAVCTPITYTLGTNRSPSLDAQAGALKKVTYLGGAEKLLTYESNIHGGVKIKEIEITDVDGTIGLNKTFSYANPVELSSSLYYRVRGYDRDNFITLFSHMPYLTFNHDELSGFFTVTEVDEILGTRTEYSFHAFYGAGADNYKKLYSPSWSFIGNTNSPGPYLIPSLSASPGVLTNKKVFTRNDNLIVQERYKYVQRENYASEDWTESTLSRLENGYYLFDQVSHVPRTMELVKIEVLNYKEDGLLGVVNHTDFFYYRNYWTLPHSIIKYNTKKDPVNVTSLWLDESQIVTLTRNYSLYSSDRTEIVRFFDYPDNIIDRMGELNIHSSPIATIESIYVATGDEPSIKEAYVLDDFDYKVSGASYNKFTTSGLFHLTETYRYLLNDTLSNWDDIINREPTLVLSNEYYNNGLLKNRESEDGLKTIYIYDEFGYLQEEKLSTGLSDLDQSSTYEHNYLIGLESVVGIDGRKISYEYDKQNRLLFSKNNEENILEKFQYNYRNEKDISIRITRTGTPITSQLITFNATDVLMYEDQDYVWNIDGIVKTGKTVNHSFSSTGSKTIMLTISNPLYREESFEKSETLFVYGSTSFTLLGPSNGCVFDDFDGNTNVNQYEFFLSHSGFPCTASVAWSYRAPGSGSFINFDNGSTSESGLLSNATLVQIGDYTIRAIVTGCHNQTFTRSFFLEDCADNGPGDGNNGGSDPTWSLQSVYGPSTQYCPNDSPTTTKNYSISINEGTHSCSNTGYTYTWQYKEVNSSSNWITKPGNSSNMGFSRNDFTRNGFHGWLPGDQLLVRVKVVDSCGTTIWSNTSSTNVSDCGGGF